MNIHRRRRVISFLVSRQNVGWSSVELHSETDSKETSAERRPTWSRSTEVPDILLILQITSFKSSWDLEASRYSESIDA